MKRQNELTEAFLKGMERLSPSERKEFEKAMLNEKAEFTKRIQDTGLEIIDLVDEDYIGYVYRGYDGNDLFSFSDIEKIEWDNWSMKYFELFNYSTETGQKIDQENVIAKIKELHEKYIKKYSPTK